VIPPGGEGKIELKVNLKGFHGNVQKSATIFSNDPKNPRVNLVMKGKIRTLIETRPGSTVFFQGQADQLGEKSIDIITASKPFQITKVESNLGDKIAYEVKTVEAGRQYRLDVKNRVAEGTYRGFIKIYTDMVQKPEILIRVAGTIEGVISVRPQSIVVGKLGPNQPVRSGKVLVISNLNKPFEITKVDYDDSVLTVSQNPLPQGRVGYSLEIAPRLEGLTKLKTAPERLEVKLTIQTSVDPQEKHEVKVYLLNR